MTLVNCLQGTVNFYQFHSYAWQGEFNGYSPFEVNLIARETCINKEIRKVVLHLLVYFMMFVIDGLLSECSTYMVWYVILCYIS